MKYLFFLLVTACMVMPAISFAQKETLTGIVKDADSGEALVGASITAHPKTGTPFGCVTDVNGKFWLQLEPGTYDVECRYTGYATQRITGVTIVVDRETNLEIALKQSRVLSEAVVVGYGTHRKSVAKTPPDRAAKKEDRSDREKPVAAMPAAERRSEPSKSSASKDSPKRPATMPAAIRKTSTPPAPPPPTSFAIDGVRPTSTEMPPMGTYDMDISMKPMIEHKVSDDLIKLEETSAIPMPPGQPAPRAGLLTAGEWNDLHHWEKHWTDLLTDGEIDQYENMYKFYPKHRYSVLLHNENDFPISDVAVQLVDNKGKIYWQARTDNSGKAELWVGLFDNMPVSETLRLEANINGKTRDLGVANPIETGLNRITVPFECKSPKNVDITWAVDATGSMGDEIEYLKTELLDVIQRLKMNNPSLEVRMGTVFYRDEGDAYVTKSSDLTNDIASTVEFIRKQNADGGGDYPEAVHSALEETINRQSWSQNAIARICFLVLDASPHQDPHVIESLQNSIREAAKKGIRIVPLSASGINKDTEFLMKFFGLATNGTYTFLTDHSGVGGKHLEPTTDEYKVESLNDLLVRIITEYTSTETCEGKSSIRFEQDSTQQTPGKQGWEAQFYPNPASDQFTLDLPIAVQSVTIYNAEGQAVRKLNNLNAGPTTIFVADLPQGFYTIRILKDNQWRSGKLMVVRKDK